MQKLPPAWVDRIFARMLVRYGSAWLRTWEGVEIDAVKEDWAIGLGGFRGDAIHYALGYLPLDRPPTLGQFRETCARAPEPKAPALAAPKADPVRLAAELKRLAELRAEMQKPANRLQWAYDIQERDKAGERLSEAQRCAYKDALQQSAAADEALMNFKSIPVDALPPAMRSDRFAAVDRELESA